MPVLSIAYVSVAASEVTDEDIEGILVQARSNNQRDSLTGALLYHAGRFVQILEGPDQTVRDRFARISEDPRHRVIQTLREKPIAERQFAQWTMGFRATSPDAAARLVGFEDFFGRSGRARLEHADNEAQQFLEWLGEYWLPRAGGSPG